MTEEKNRITELCLYRLQQAEEKAQISKHSGTISFFDKEFVKTGINPKIKGAKICSQNKLFLKLEK